MNEQTEESLPWYFVLICILVLPFELLWNKIRAIFKLW